MCIDVLVYKYLYMKKHHLEELLGTISSIGDEKLLEKFLRDLLTPVELEDIVKRWQIVKQLHEGIPQRTIAKNLKVSIAKITRGSRELADERGGFNLVLKSKL